MDIVVGKNCVLSLDDVFQVLDVKCGILVKFYR